MVASKFWGRSGQSSHRATRSDPGIRLQQSLDPATGNHWSRSPASTGVYDRQILDQPITAGASSDHAEQSASKAIGTRE